MKRNLRILALTGILAAAGCFATACDDTDDNSSNNTPENFTGTYNLTEVNAPTAVDFNRDGTSSVNLMDESNCYNSSTMNIHDDGTFSMTSNSVDIADNASSCGTQTTVGTWLHDGNNFTTSSTTTGGLISTTTYTFEKGSTSENTHNVIRRIMTNSNYPTINSDGNPEYANGDVSLVFTRE